MFIAALFTIGRTWKQPRCPSADDQIKKLWYIYKVKYFSAIKRNTLESILVRWMNLEPVIQTEVSQKENKYYVLGHISGIQKNVWFAGQEERQRRREQTLDTAEEGMN